MTYEYWNPMTKSCVYYCPEELQPSTGKVCKTCAQINSNTPFFDPIA